MKVITNNPNGFQKEIKLKVQMMPLRYTDELLVFRWVLNCAPLVADLFLFCYERDFMTSLSDVKQAEIIEAFKPTSRYLDDLF